MNTPVRQRGISLIEVIMFMVIVGVAVVGVLSVYVTTTRSSADPLVRKQSLAIAESLIEEVRSMPFTFCDPDDPNVHTAAAVGDCTTAEGSGPEVAQGETRYSATNPFDNVNDYNGFAMASPAICDISGACIAALVGYAATVTVTPTAVGVIPAADALLITVTVTGPTAEAISLAAVRTRHAPNF